MKPVSKAQADFCLRFLYVFWIALGVIGLNYIPGLLVHNENAARTAEAISQNQMLFRIGIAANVLMNIVFVFAAIFLYKLLSETNRDLAALMVILALIGVPIALLGEAASLMALNQINMLDQMMHLLGIHDNAYVMAGVFWGAWLFPLGFLVLDSGYFPKFIAWAVLTGGLGHLLGAFAKILVPKMVIVGTICEILTMGELVFALWLGSEPIN